VLNKSTKLRLRPSVSIIPTKDHSVYEFFQSNTRKIRHVKFQSKLHSDAILCLDNKSIDDIQHSIKNESIKKNINDLLLALYDWCFIEECEVAKNIEKNPYRRILNFLADFYPSNQLFDFFNTISNSTVFILGLGGVGSWVATCLSQLGVKNFILCDPDIVKLDNLNRALFTLDDLGKFKTKVISKRIQDVEGDSVVKTYEELINSESELINILNEDIKNINLIINAADYPNVDFTSKIISKICLANNIPHIISGGYNLHLSLIGPTILPYESACFKCIEIGMEERCPPDFENVTKLHRAKRNIGNISPLAGISAAFTINEAIKVLAKSKRLYPTMVNRRGEFNFLTSTIKFTDFHKQSNCPWCGK